MTQPVAGTPAPGCSRDKRSRLSRARHVARPYMADGAMRGKVRQFQDSLLMFAKYSVGAQRAAPALARHLLCPKTTLYSAGIKK